MRPKLNVINRFATARLLDLWAALCAFVWLVWQILLRPAGKAAAPIIKSKRLRRGSALTGASVGLTFLAGLGAGFVTLGVENRPPEDADLWTINRPPSLTILDKDGEEAGHRGSRFGKPVPPVELPPFVIEAFLATEDRRFYRHHGIDPRGLVRASLTNLRTGSLREGASTVSQQLARNLFLSNDRTVRRKVQEMQLALWLEANYSKEEILSLYLNRVYLGSGNYGIGAAAQFYFSKDARDLTLKEAAVLAGLPKAPSTLTPARNPEGANARSSEVLGNLVQTGFLDRDAARAADREVLALKLDMKDADLGYFFDYVAAETESGLGIETLSGDVVIHTTIDRKLQEKAQEIIRTGMTEDLKAQGANQAALIAYDQTGAIIAMVGGLSYEDSQFNRATQAKRQPGSIFKPFVYLAALESGMSTRTMFVDQEVSVDGWEPTNYSGRHDGPMRMTDALANSVNTIAVQVTETIGRDKVIKAARNLGISGELLPVPSIALGSIETTLSEITAAYLPFARGGLSASPYAITRIETRTGELLYERLPQPEKQLFSAEVSRNMNHLLYQVMITGTGSRASLGRRDAGGKTGTTNEWKDAWFVGYTAQITAGVWVGNDANEPMDKVTGGSAPARMWKAFMLAAHDGLPRKDLPGAFPAPSREGDLRLVQFYDGLAGDFLATSTGGAEVVWQGADPYEDDTTRAVPMDPEPEPRRRRFWRRIR